MVSKTSPAKTFPNSLNDKEMIFAISETISNIPIKNLMGFWKFKNFLICEKKPTAMIPKMLVITTEITAKANVKFRSAAGERKNGTSFPWFLIKKEPTPGKMPSRLDTIIKIKMVAMREK